MPKAGLIFSRLNVNVFIFLITFSLLSGCANHSVAPVSEKSYGRNKIPSVHVVIPGDTLFSIAWRYGLKYEVLARHNDIKPPYIIRPSQIIRLDVVRINDSSSLASPKANPDVPLTREAFRSSGVTPHSKIKKTAKVYPQSQPSGFSGAVQWRWPASGPLLSSFQSNSGLNKGIDIGGKLGEPVLAAASGRVVYSGSGLRGYGKLLIIKHNETFLSAYAHNHALMVKEGDIVKVGQVIAEMGSSGSDRVKLHFEIRRDGTPVDPMKFLPRR